MSHKTKQLLLKLNDFDSFRSLNTYLVKILKLTNTEDMIDHLNFSISIDIEYYLNFLKLVIILIL